MGNRTSNARGMCSVIYSMFDIVLHSRSMLDIVLHSMLDIVLHSMLDIVLHSMLDIVLHSMLDIVLHSMFDIVLHSMFDIELYSMFDIEPHSKFDIEHRQYASMFDPISCHSRITLNFARSYTAVHDRRKCTASQLTRYIAIIIIIDQLRAFTHPTANQFNILIMCFPESSARPDLTSSEDQVSRFKTRFRMVCVVI